MLSAYRKARGQVEAGEGKEGCVSPLSTKELKDNAKNSLLVLALKVKLVKKTNKQKQKKH